MTGSAATRAFVLERVLPLPPERVWRALTDRALIAQWLMPNDFQPEVGATFRFRLPPQPGWNGVTDCRVLALEPPRHLEYSWNASGDEAEGGLATVVDWTLAPAQGGTRVRLEQSGFRPQDERQYQGAAYGWPRFLEALERVAADVPD